MNCCPFTMPWFWLCHVLSSRIYLIAVPEISCLLLKAVFKTLIIHNSDWNIKIRVVKSFTVILCCIRLSFPNTILRPAGLFFITQKRSCDLLSTPCKRITNYKTAPHINQERERKTRKEKKIGKEKKKKKKRERNKRERKGKGKGKRGEEGEEGMGRRGGEGRY